MKKPFLLLLALVLTVPAIAQKCLTAEKVLQSMAQHPEMKQRVDEIEAFTQEYIRNEENIGSAKKTTSVHTIPVVVHILYITPTENISDTQVMSGFKVLNEAFRGLNPLNKIIPAAFQPFVADAEIEFCLAKVAPDGTETNGVIRKQVSADFEGSTDYFDPSKGGNAPWDPERYLNVYLVRLVMTHLGFTYKPGTAPKGEEGVVIDYRSWGTVGEAAKNPPYNLGITAVHEFGHYLNLDHPWGMNGGCNSDDGIADIPPQYGPVYGCPKGVMYDLCTNTGDGLMYMNYMDYGDDLCSAMFSKGQKLRMKAALAGPLGALGVSDKCNKLAVTKFSKAKFSISPNPSADLLTIKLRKGLTFHVDIINSMGAVVMSVNANTEIQIPVDKVPSGAYFVRMISDVATSTERIIISH